MTIKAVKVQDAGSPLEWWIHCNDTAHTAFCTNYGKALFSGAAMATSTDNHTPSAYRLFCARS